MPAKGGQFERDFSTQLSLWWTKGQNDSVFWRTSNSGGRATVRQQKGKFTYGQFGDITSIDPIGEPLVRYMIFELKRGYPKADITRLIDKPKKAKEEIYEEWIRKSMKNAKQSNCPSWCIVHKKDRREATITLPSDIAGRLLNNYKFNFIEVILDGINVIYFKLDDFFKNVNPNTIKEIMQNVKKT